MTHADPTHPVGSTGHTEHLVALLAEATGSPCGWYPADRGPTITVTVYGGPEGDIPLARLVCNLVEGVYRPRQDSTGTPELARLWLHLQGR